MSGSLWLLGAGNMGRAMLRGWTADGIEPGTITVIDPAGVAVPDGVRALTTIPADEWPDILILAVKPQLLGAVSDQLATQDVRCRLLISILAGVEVGTLQRAVAAEQVVRAMPNLPAAIGKGMTALYSPARDAVIASETERLMSPLGKIEWLSEESQFDAVTALSGSGPGFVFRFIEALADAGGSLGLPPDQALRLAVGTVEGAALLAASSPFSPAELAAQVASPGGTTQAGLDVLDRDRALHTLVTRTLEAARARSAELAAQTRAGSGTSR